MPRPPEDIVTDDEKALKLIDELNALIKTGHFTRQGIEFIDAFSLKLFKTTNRKNIYNK